MTALDFVTRMVAALEKLGIPYMAVGSFSTNVYGTPRATKDADFVVQLGDRSMTAVATAIGDDFVLDPQMSFESITSTLRYRLQHRKAAFLIEVFLLSDDAHDRIRFERRVTGNLGEGRRAVVPTAEDVIVTKLRWSRQGQRTKDLNDVKEVLIVQAGRLDLDYIRGWCDQHGTRDLFEHGLTYAEGVLQGRP